jgi:hypothetical protein
MADVSIYNVIRSSKVTTGNAAMYSGMRTFDSSAQVCPTRSNVSDSGIVGVSRDSVNSYAPGCFSALDRMIVENVQRPRYSTYLNASAINIPGIGDDDLPQPNLEYQSKPYYDTQLGYTYVRPVQPRNTMTPPQLWSDMKPVGNVSAQDTEANNVSCFMDRTYENRNCEASPTA